ncbi:methyltransferase, FxLD system [Nocardia sp. NRRL S-836]|uniref:methyltransferase, FxLD system n=1 Tax=Nocardia sp. NRRL S-836 TaxID=1519492 RepID=UPI0018D16131|nr:methyltransferase, FxLD system [Nocardia sp. NRRL S-836]
MTTHADLLRHTLVDTLAQNLTRRGLTLFPDVERALRTVPRDKFVPEVELERAYADTAVVTKRREDGTGLSSVSAPNMITDMLLQAHGTRGLAGAHVLEIGSGGYNAALLRELVGESGSVTTVDIDSEVTDRARRCLDAAGYHDVAVVCADAEYEIEAGRRYDLIIVTVGAWDIPPAWIGQLTDSGVLVVPLRTHGTTRSWELRRTGDQLISLSNMLAGFVPMQGAGQREGWSVALHEQVTLWLNEIYQQQFDGTHLDGVLAHERREAGTGVIVPGGRRSADLDLWLATHLPDFAMMISQQSAVTSGLVSPASPFGTPALAHDSSLAYRGRLKALSDTEFEHIVYGHGPDAEQVVQQMAEQIRAWDAAGRPAPTLHVTPIDAPEHDLPHGQVLTKRHSRLVFAWN